MKRLLSPFTLVLALMLCMVPTEAQATAIASGTCGANLTWEITGPFSDAVLTISGEGEMYDYEIELGDQPWRLKYGDLIQTIIVEEGVTRIGNGAFAELDNAEKVLLPDTLTHIGANSFVDSGLLNIIIPSNVCTIEYGAFGCCQNLNTVIFTGNACTFSQSTFIQFDGITDATCYYPSNDTTWTEDILQNYGGEITWIPYDYVDSHFVVKDDAVKARCTIAGLTEGSSCILCGQVFIEQEIIPATGHTEVVDKAVPATCVSSGKTESSHCSVCKIVIKAQETIPATGVHTYENGKCKDCGAEEPVKIAAPTVKISGVSSSGKPKLTWAKVDGAVKYEVYRSKTGKDGSFSRITRVTGTSLVNKSAEAGTKYYYKVKAVDANGNVSDFSNRVSRICDLARPVVKTSNDAATGKIKLTWAKIDGAKSYKVYRATSQNGKYTLMKTVTGTTYTNSTAKAGTKYYYKVIAVHSNSDANSAYSEVVSRMADLARPVVTIKRNDAGKPKLTWEKVTGAAKYEVWRATSKNGTYRRIKTVTKTSFTNTGATAGKTYYYKVKAIHSNTNANSAFSTIKYIKAK